MSSSTLRIQLFGPLRIYWDGESFPFSSLPKTLPLLAYLLLNRDTPIPRDTLAFTLWPDVTEKEARTNLRRHLHNLNRALPESDIPWVLRESGTVQWNPDAPYWLDVAAFEYYCTALDRIEDAINLYIEDLLPEVYADWLSFERKRLENLYIQSLSTLSTDYRQNDDFQKALNLNLRLLRQDPWNEIVIREIMTLRYLMGDRAGALNEFQQFQISLRDELDVSPMSETEALYTAIQRGDSSLMEVSKTADMRTLEKSIPLKHTPLHQIPTPVRSIVGRETDIEAINALIGGQKPVTRLLTLIGPSGIGKTRLALEIASRLFLVQPEYFSDGIIFVHLSALTNHNLVLPTLAEALGIQIRGTKTRQKIIENLRYRKILLVLDNFEHLIEAAPEIAALLQGASCLRVLVTSQIRLNLYGEQEYRVSPLPLPDLRPNTSLDELRAAASIRLFEERAQAIFPQFSLNDQNALTIVEICAQLDGLPLALELAATRVRMYSPEGILTQLADRLDFLTTRARDVDDRHRNLRAALEWSVDLLEFRERELFIQLAIFPRGFFVEDVQAILMPTKTIVQTLGLLELLEEKSIIQIETFHGERSRFYMPTALRVYAQELLQTAGGLPDLKLRFLQYHFDEYQHASQGLKGNAQKTWLDRIQLEINNLRTALEWAFELPGDETRVVLGARILRAIQVFWNAKGMYQEALKWYQEALAHQQKIVDLDLRISILYVAGLFASYQGMFEQANIYIKEGLQIARKFGEPQPICNGLQFLAMVVGRQGDYERAATLLREAIEMERACNPGQVTYNLSTAINNLGLVLKNLGDYEGAVELLTETIEIDQARGNRMGEAAGLTNMGDLAIFQEDYTHARQCYREALKIRHEMGQVSGIIKSLSGTAHLAVAQEQFIRSATLYAANLHMRQKMNFPIPPQLQHELNENLSQIKASLTPDEFDAAWAAGEAMTIDAAVAYALDG